MERLWTILGVADVQRSLAWYQSLLGLPERPPSHEDFGQLLSREGLVLLCLHAWGAHDHPPLRTPEAAPPGNGLLLFFRVDDFAGALTRARGLGSPFEEDPHTNPNTQTSEFSLRDPDGYFVSVSAQEA